MYRNRVYVYLVPIHLHTPRLYSSRAKRVISFEPFGKRGSLFKEI